LRPAVRKAAAHASALIHPEFVNSPILRRSLVNIASGTTAKLSCMLSTIWLRTSRRAVPLCPQATVTTIAGTIAVSTSA
jgi:hypothetical protein